MLLSDARTVARVLKQAYADLAALISSDIVNNVNMLSAGNHKHRHRSKQKVTYKVTLRSLESMLDHYKESFSMGDGWCNPDDAIWNFTALVDGPPAAATGALVAARAARKALVAAAPAAARTATLAAFLACAQVSKKAQKAFDDVALRISIARLVVVAKSACLLKFYYLQTASSNGVGNEIYRQNETKFVAL